MYNSLFTVYYSLCGQNSELLYVEYSLFTVTIQPNPFRDPLNEIENRYNTIFSCEGWTTKGPGKPYTRFGPDFQRTLYAFSPFQFNIRRTTDPCLIQPVLDQTRWSPLTGVQLLVVKGTWTPNLKLFTIHYSQLTVHYSDRKKWIVNCEYWIVNTLQFIIRPNNEF